MPLGSGANTFPPLISGTSWDASGLHHIVGNEIIASTLASFSTTDAFYSPQDGELSGFAADGFMYNIGVKDETKSAPWALEAPGPWRSSKREFPNNALILLTDAGMSIVDRDDNYALWMLFIRRDDFAFTNNPFDKIVAGFTPTSLSFHNGIISVQCTPDKGANQFQDLITLYIDFVKDQVYFDSPSRPDVAPLVLR
jgi:hypothetical protein